MVKDAVAGGQNRIRRNQKSSAGVYPAIGKGDGEIADGVVRRHIGTGNQIAIVFTDYFSRNLNGALGNIFNFVNRSLRFYGVIFRLIRNMNGGFETVLSFDGL